MTTSAPATMAAPSGPTGRKAEEASRGPMAQSYVRSAVGRAGPGSGTSGQALEREGRVLATAHQFGGEAVGTRPGQGNGGLHGQQVAGIQAQGGRLADGQLPVGLAVMRD